MNIRESLRNVEDLGIALNLSLIPFLSRHQASLFLKNLRSTTLKPAKGGSDPVLGYLF